MEIVWALISSTTIAFGLAFSGVNPLGAAFLGISVVSFLASIDLIVNS